MFKSGIIISFFTLLSRVFGLLRELFVAYLFGSDSTADSINVAFKLPNLFRRIFAEGALANVFIPIFNAKIVDSKRDAEFFAGKVLVLLFIILSLLVLLMILFMPQLILLIAPGFYKDVAKLNLTILLCRITISYLIFIAIVALLGSILNSFKKFAAFAFTPVIFSSIIIAGTWGLQQKMLPEIAMSISLLLAGILQLIFMCIVIRRNNISIPILFTPFDKDIRKMVINMGPAVISNGSQQLALFISQSLASFIPGAVSILSYADRIYQFPLSIIGISFATLLLPELSRVYKIQDLSKASQIQDKSILACILFSFPATFGIIVLAKPIIHVVYERGAFTALDTINTSYTLSLFTLGLPAFILSKILTTIFYAKQNTKTPLKITLYTLSVNIILNALLLTPFKGAGIAIGSSIAAWYNVWLLVKNLQYQNFNLKLISNFTAKTLFCSAIMSLVILVVRYYYEEYFYSSSYLIKISMLLGSIFIGIVVFVLQSLYIRLHNILLIKK